MAKPISKRVHQRCDAVNDYETRDSDDPDLRAELSEAAAFLLPIAQEHYRRGKWSIEPAAWLTMVRDSLAPKAAADIN